MSSELLMRADHMFLSFLIIMNEGRESCLGDMHIIHCNLTCNWGQFSLRNECCQ